MSSATAEVGQAKSSSVAGPGVLLVGNFLSGHGLSRGVCEELAVMLRESGWSVLTTSNKRSRFARLADTVATVWRLRSEYSVAQVDVFSGPAFALAEAACWALQTAGRPYVLTLHGGNLPQFAARWPRRVRRLLNSAALVTTPSSYLQSQMSLYCRRLKILPNALRIANYPYRFRRKALPNLVWLRAFNEIYNPILAPDVIELLLRDHPQIQLTMAGADKKDGSLQQTIEKAQSIGVSNHIHFRGPIPKPEVPAFLSTGDVFLNTTNFDNTPVSVLEAMACGLCVVSTNVGGLPYLLEDGQDALLVPPNDPAAMAEAVRRVFTEPGLAERLSQNARKKAEQFDWSVILPRWQRTLASLISCDQPE